MTLVEDLPECLGTIFDCDDPTPKCRNSARFDFPTMWNVTHQYWKQCPNGPWLFKQPGSVGNVSEDDASLTNVVCEAIAGLGPKRYPGSDIWARLTTWKFPLYQLLATSPRPPLSVCVEAFTFVHLLGDPIGTITDLLRKVDGCQSRAVFWQDSLSNELTVLRNESTAQGTERLWKSLAIVIDSYDEWGTDVGDRAQRCLLAELILLCSPQFHPHDRKRYLRLCLQTADALAADRSTKFLPVIVAQGFFISTVAIAMIRTKSLSAGVHPGTFIDIEMYSIAFTAQYFWVILTVVWTSIIGVSQTAGALPRILGRFHNDLRKEFPANGVPALAIDLPTNKLTEHRRIYNGGICSWQPGQRWRPAAHNSTLEHVDRRGLQNIQNFVQSALLATILRFWPAIHSVLPLLIVAVAAGTGQAISALVPPVGWSCRSGGMMWIFITWVGSYLITITPLFSNLDIQFYVTFIKDLVCIGITTGIIIYTQVGIYNRCSCYTQSGQVGLQLPEMPAAKSILEARLHGLYPLVMALGIAIQLVLVPGLLVWRYHAAVKVFLQRDDGASNMEWWHRFNAWRKRGRYAVVVNQDVVMENLNTVVEPDEQGHGKDAVATEEVEGVVLRRLSHEVKR